MTLKEEALAKHYEWKGKIEVISGTPIKNREQLSLAYTPGVAEPCLDIAKDPMKLYDMLNASKVLNLIIGLVPDGEFYYLNKTTHEMASNIVAYRNSAMGIMEAISADYSNLDLNATDIQKKLNDPDNMALLKDVLSKLG